MFSNCLKAIKTLNATIFRNFHLTAINNDTLLHMHLRGGRPPNRPNTKNPIGNNPHLRGVVLKLMVLKPKKPSSGNRKVVLVRLTNGREIKAYVPGEAHNLQEHSVVLVEGGRRKDLMGVLCRCVPGKYDFIRRKKGQAQIAGQPVAA